MLLVLQSLVPVLALIALGFAIRAWGLLDAADWRGVERVTYYVLIPALMIHTLAMSDLSQAPVGRVALALIAPTMMTAAIAWLCWPLRRLLGIDGPAFTSVFQGAVRWNSFIALGLTGALYGKEGLAICAIAFAVLIPFVNLASLVVLGRYGARRQPFKVVPFTLTLLRNPFVWSTLLGLSLQIAGLHPPFMVATTLDVLGRGVLACGLLIVGAGLDPSALKALGRGFVAASVLKLVVAPVIAGLLGQSLGLSGVALAVPIIAAAVPTAAASYILARQQGGDAPLMAAIITGQTMAAAMTLPLMLLVFSA
jgi:malonate transporter and related proteins